MKSEIVFMEKLGDSIMSELETAEDEVCKAWGEWSRTFALNAPHRFS
jgi:hypothetical protein